MTAFGTTQQTYQSKGLREDLANFIYNISPTETPFMSNAGRTSMKATLHEWQTDTLAAAVSTNAHIEGDDTTAIAAASATTRVGNYSQIQKKFTLISDTLEEVDKAGRKSEEAFQLAKRSKELKRDMEKTALENIGANAGGDVTARLMATLGAWVKTNVNHATDGTSPVYTSGVPAAARTDGTTRAFTEVITKDVMTQCYNTGAEPTTLMVGPFNKGVVSTFSGVATKTFYQSAVKQTAVIGAVDVYVSDFGILAVVPNRFQRERDAWFLDYEFVSAAFLRSFRTVKLAKTGDAEKRMIVVEWTLRVNNEAALGLAADLSTS
jgi:hypothetical protein